ncbi:Protein trichome birefringence-like 25 [Linum grandiflorum]
MLCFLHTLFSACSVYLHALFLACSVFFFFVLTEINDDLSEKCDLFAGEWVRDPSGPFYTNRSCHEIQDHQNCMRNGRPDSEYLYWRWRPNGCDLRKFNPRKFLKLMRNKSMAFIGDSISRNHVQSLLCILSQVLIIQKG